MKVKDAKEVFTALVEAMEADNGCEFDTTVDQVRRGEQLVLQMMANGWNPDKLTEGVQEPWYQNDIEVFSAGEHRDVELIAKTYEGGEELSDLLNTIFEEG